MNTNYKIKTLKSLENIIYVSLIGKNPNNASAIIPYYGKQVLLQKDQITQTYITSFLGMFWRCLK